jgi:hypothetical protein
MLGSLSRRLLVVVALLALVDPASARPFSLKVSGSRSGSFSMRRSGSFSTSRSGAFSRFSRSRSFTVGRTFTRPAGLKHTPITHAPHFPIHERPFHGRAPAHLHGFPIAANPFIGPRVTLRLSTPATGPRLVISRLGVAGNPYLGGPPNLGASSRGVYGAGGYGASGSSFAAALDGYADLTRATGSYWENISVARIEREVANQMMIDTEHKRIEYLRWLESTRDTAPKMLDREMAADLELARKGAPATVVWSARPLNALLWSIQAGGSLDRAPSPSLPPDVLRHINVTDGAEHGNLALFKDGGHLDWPDALTAPAFDKTRARLARNLRIAVDQLKHNEPLDRAAVGDIEADFRTLSKAFADGAEELTPAQFIEAKRFLNRLSEATRALSDPKAMNYFNGKWAARGKNVAELVTWMTSKGLILAPAAPGDEAAYNVLYLALRQYEAALRPSSELTAESR